MMIFKAPGLNRRRAGRLTAGPNGRALALAAILAALAAGTAAAKGAAEPGPAAAAAGIGPDMLLLPSVQNMGDRWPGSWDNYGFTLRYLLFSRLLRANAAIEPVYGDLAQSWTVSPDGLRYDFTLRTGVTWHDGAAFTPDDAAFSIKTALKSPQVNALIKSAFNRIKGAEAFAADPARTPASPLEGITIEGSRLTITMDQPSGTLLLALSQFNILPRHKIEGVNPLQINSSAFYDWPIGTGPYRITEFKPNDYLVLEAYDGYFGAAPAIRRIKVTQMTEKDFATRALADDIDFFQTNDLATAQAALKNPHYKAFPTDIYFVRYFQWNSHGLKGEGGDPLADIRVRRALIHAIDRKDLLDSLLPGQAALINSKVPASFDYANHDVYDLDYDPAKAKRLLQEAGFDFGTTIRLATYYGDQTTADLMDAVCAYLHAIGVKAEWRMLSGDLGAQIYDIRDYHLMYAGLSAMTFEEAYNVFYSQTVKGSVMAKIFPEGATAMDPLLEKLWVTVDPAERRRLQMEIQRVETDEMLWHLPLFSLRNIQVFNTARLTLPPELTLSNEWTNYERYFDKWILRSSAK